MNKKIKKKYPTPVGFTDEIWDNYLKAVEKFGNNFIKKLTDTLIEVNEEMEEE